MNQPDPKKHQQISFIKSGLRIVGYLLLVISPIAAVTFLIYSEALGVIEEMV